MAKAVVNSVLVELSAADSDALRASVPPPPTIGDYSRAIQEHLDQTAKLRSYDSIHTAVGYRDDPNPVFAAEGQALFVWGSAVWTLSMSRWGSSRSARARSRPWTSLSQNCDQLSEHRAVSGRSGSAAAASYRDNFLQIGGRPDDGCFADAVIAEIMLGHFGMERLVPDEFRALCERRV